MSKELERIIEKTNEIARREGLRASSQRECIIRILYEKRDMHLSPEEILSFAKSRCEGASISSIYRILNFLEKEGVVNAIEVDATGKKYEINIGVHHDHFVCTGCGKIIEFYNPDLESIQESIVKDLGAVASSHDLIIYGVCRECLVKKRAASA